MPNYQYDHVHLVSPDPEKTARFYETMFNARILSTRTLADGRTVVDLDLNGWPFRVMDRQAASEAALSDPEQIVGLGHICLKTDDMEASIRHFRKNGVSISNLDQPRPGFKILFVLAPDNVMIELLESPDTP